VRDQQQQVTYHLRVTGRDGVSTASVQIIFAYRFRGLAPSQLSTKGSSAATARRLCGSVNDSAANRDGYNHFGCLMPAMNVANAATTRRLQCGSVDDSAGITGIGKKEGTWHRRSFSNI
jgi:hypothetical protein